MCNLIQYHAMLAKRMYLLEFKNYAEYDITYQVFIFFFYIK